MIPIKECKEYLADVAISDEEVEMFRDALYSLAEVVLDEHYEGYNKEYGN